MPLTADYPGLYTDVASSAHALLQSHSWITRDPDTRELHLIDLDAMTPSHRAHLLDWLRRNAHVMRGHVHRSINQSQRWGAITWVERAELIRDLEVHPPEVWIEDTPLVRRLVQLEPPAAPRRERQRWLPQRLRRNR
ncbi:MAG: hypothetical protein J0I34_07470 [Pseudonocardia sp.]|uniref:hypothetical protein n=1 Tax=Actinomycetes TaxID=1760 RepID=UPI00086A157A|nr:MULTISPECIES: hypothetical protein [Actinomycetes]MBN9108607.1 hypothetical protein [Pseudonocardia sp.]ODU27486.1 MAG: hypothetical protein ABS80_03655 [Pseudonocardia sp. SCN 72-51]ODV07752.1 MAG: hypothetical protein ABT15_06665 [Pseudonocardia sp. SCN 73-27]